MMSRLTHRVNGSSTIATGSDRRTIGSLLRELTDESRTLLRQEVALAKAEISEKASLIGRRVACLAAGALLAFAGLLGLLVAAGTGLYVALSSVMDADIAIWLAPLLVGGVVGAVGIAMAAAALASLRHQNFTPRKTLDSLREDTQWLKERIT